jgi:hypothetical protein
MKSRLTCTILALATISLQTPKKITQERSKWGVRGLSLAFQLFWSKISKRERMRGGMRVFIPPLPETSRWESGTRKLRVYVWILRTRESGDSEPDGFCGLVTVTRRLRVYVQILRTLCPDIPD